MVKLKALLLVMLMIFSLPMYSFADENETDAGESDENSTEDNTDSEGDSTEEDSSESEGSSEEDTTEDDSGDTSNDEENSDDTTEDNSEDTSDESTEDETDESSGEDAGEEVVDEEDTNIVRDLVGAKLRVKQLELKISQHILIATDVTAYIEELEDTTVDTEALNGILESMEALQIEVSEIDVEGKTKEELADEFVALKSDGKELTEDFREEIKGKLSDEERDALKEVIEAAKAEHKENAEEEIQGIKDEIKALRDEFNANRVREKFERAGLDNPELLRKVQNGEVTPAQIREEFKERLNGVDPERRKEIVAKAKEFRAQATEEQKERFKEFKEKVKERDKVRDAKIKERVEKFQDRVDDKVKERLKERKDKINPEIRERIKNANLTDKQKERLRNAVGENGEKIQEKLRNNPELREKVQEAAKKLGDRKPSDITPDEARDLIKDIDPNLIAEADN